MTDSVDPNQTVNLTAAGQPGEVYDNILFSEDMIGAPRVDGAWTIGEAAPVAGDDGWDLVPFTEEAESVLLPDATERWQAFNRMREAQALDDFATGGETVRARVQQAAAAQAALNARRAWPRRALFAGLGVVALAGVLYGAGLIDGHASVRIFPPKMTSTAK